MTQDGRSIPEGIAFSLDREDLVTHCSHSFKTIQKLPRQWRYGGFHYGVQTEGKMGSIDQLKSEVERLSSELQQACLEKVQAAEYGLAVLDEKQRLQEQYDELETLLESNKQELECLKEVFCRK